MNGNHDELILEKISGIKEDIAEVKVDVKDLKKNCAARLICCNKTISSKIGFKGFIATVSLFLMGAGVILIIV